MNAHVIIGAGGTGGLLAAPLATYLNNLFGNRGESFDLVIMDGDHYESSNLERQVFDPTALGQNKAVVLANTINRAYGVSEYLTDENIDTRLANGDTIIICADNHDVRGRVARWAERVSDCTIFNAGNEDFWGTVQVYRRRAGQHLDAPIYWNHPEILEPSTADPSKLDCATRATMPNSEQTTAANLLSAAMLLAAITNHYISEGGPNETDWRFKGAITAESYERSGKGWEDATA